MIPKTFEEAFSQTTKLVEQFEQNESKFLKDSSYQEANVRQDYLDKFFVALGWDVYHNEQTNPYEREVHIERSINVQGRGKRADYAFFVAPDFQQTRWIAEAKKPMHNLENKDYCFQTLRYGWNSNTPLAILTDFDRFFILDSRYKPSIETAIDRIHKRFHYKDFADEEKFREIYYLFSREAVADGAIEKYAQSLKKGRGVRQSKLANTGIIQPVDDEFLSELDEQRGELARAFKNRNPQLDGEALTEITQRTLDRLVFIRFLEDKLVEPSEIIDKLGTKSNSAWQDFVAESRRLDKIYNGIIFKEHTILDTPDFAPDEKTFEDIRDWISHKNSPYDFNTIPIHILGSAYERFLGKTIVATEKRAKVEEKPEVRKAGGVYYTPEYIVRYIVQNTIGKLIEGKTPEEIAEMRFADIACGSGSFLLGVFDYLIAYHVGYFDKNKNRRNNAIKNMQARETVDGTLQLTLGFKREILLANIYGVDLDAQAVEVAQLSLYLKLLEEETTATAQQTFADFRTQLLPSLNENISDGNSLIDFDVINQSLFDSKNLRKLNPMSFKETFKQVFQDGGFDAIIGNPPYIRIQTMKEFSPLTVEQLKKDYDSAKKGNYDIYVVFIEKALQLLKENGKLGYILPHKFFNAKYGEEIRRIVAKGKHLEHIVHFGDQQVFDGATTYTSLFFLNKNETNEFEFIKVDDLTAWRESSEAITGKINSELVSKNEWNFVVGEGSELFAKLFKTPHKLGDIADIFVGLQTSADDVFILDYISENETFLQLKSKALNKIVEVEKVLFHPIISGVDVKKYIKLQERQFILFPYEVDEDTSYETISLKSISEKYPQTFKYLEENKNRLEMREKGKFKGKNWHRFGRAQNIGIQNRIKICVPRLVDNLQGTLDVDGSHYLDNVDVGGVTLKDNPEFLKHDLKYILALINSKLSVWYFPFVSATFRGGFYSANRQFLSQLPIRTIDFENRQDTERHDKLVGLVEQMLDAKLKLSGANTDKDKQFYERFCSSLDSQIDTLVYELYELTDEEIAIVENG